MFGYVYLWRGCGAKIFTCWEHRLPIKKPKSESARTKNQSTAFNFRSSTYSREYSHYICWFLLCYVCIKSKQVLLTLLGWTGRRRCCLFGDRYSSTSWPPHVMIPITIPHQLICIRSDSAGNFPYWKGHQPKLRWKSQK